MKSNSAGFSGKIAETLFFVVVGALYAWALSQSVQDATIFNLPSLRLLTLCAGFVLLFNLMLWNKYTAIGTTGFALLCVIGVLTYLFVQDFEVGWFVSLQEGVDGTIAYAIGQTYYRDEFSVIFGYALSFLLALVTVLNTRVHLGFISLAIMALGVIAMPMHMEWERSELAILVMLFCLLALLAKRLYLSAQHRKDGQPQSSLPARYGLMLLPLCLLIFGVGWALPKPDAETMENLSAPNVSRAVDSIVHAFAPDQTMSFTGNEQRLGGPVTPNDLVVMVVQASERIYFTGAIRDLYTGYSWRSTQRETQRLTPDEDGVFHTNRESEHRRDTHERLRHEMGWPVREVIVTAMDVRTNAIFTPPFHQTLEITPHMPVDQNAYGNLSASRVMPLDASYTQSYISIDTHSEAFSNMLRREGSDFDQEELAIFLQLPDTLPDRVGALARELTAGAGTNYDRLRILEAFLAQFPYTLDTEPLPMGEDFVDHFLFTSREGYCVHYASAMVIMARTLGIPARFVEGFIMPESPAGDGRFWITNRHAHAWVEAYFPQFGWVSFEPTAAYNLNFDINMGLPVFMFDPDTPLDYPELWISEDDWFPGFGSDDPLAGADENSGFPWVGVITLLVLGGGGFFAYLRLSARYRSKQSSLEAMPNREAVVALFASTLNAAGAGGCPISPGETALVYAGRTSREPVFAGLGVDIKQLAGLYSKAAYSTHEVTAYERAAIQSARDKVLSRLRAAPRNLPRYWVDRYLLLKY